MRCRLCPLLVVLVSERFLQVIVPLLFATVLETNSQAAPSLLLAALFRNIVMTCNNLTQVVAQEMVLETFLALP